MGELRFNIVTNEWVIVAPERAKRPSDFRRTGQRPKRTIFSRSCPFCPGNEHQSEHETLRLPEGDSQWQTRVVLNKYPALSADAGPPVEHDKGLKLAVSGYGIHEVIIETPRHDLATAELPTEQVKTILTAYRARYRELTADPNISHIILFKNHGESAGTSLIHPHSQLIATPIVSSQVEQRLAIVGQHSSDHNECLMCAVIRDELKDGVRILYDSEHFVAMIPYAALSVFHTWIVPKRHAPTFGVITDDEVDELAFVLRHVLRMFFFGLDDPDFNFVVRSSPRDRPGFHWYLSIIPRVARAAGFELGSGMFINPSSPERSADFLRHVKLGPDG